MDPLTNALYGHGEPIMRWDDTPDGPPRETVRALERIVKGSFDSCFERGLEAAWMCACPQGAQVNIDGYDSDEETFVSVDFWFEGLIESVGLCTMRARSILIHEVGRTPYCRGELADFSPAGSGVGVRYFGMLTHRLSEGGFARFNCEAAGWSGSRYNGYYTWAALGADLILSKDLVEAACRAGFPTVRSTHELFRYPGAQRWWLENGRTSEALFDLSANSRHFAILRNYMKAKRVELT